MFYLYSFVSTKESLSSNVSKTFAVLNDQCQSILCCSLAEIFIGNLIFFIQQAEDNGLLFIPLPNRRHEGKAVYTFGKCVIYIDRDVVFHSTEGKWKPSSLQELVDLAR